jgi:hypothetical protein
MADCVSQEAAQGNTDAVGEIPDSNLDLPIFVSSRQTLGDPREVVEGIRVSVLVALSVYTTCR